eukprot:1782631-Prymnesium_polylepis.1
MGSFASARGTLGARRDNKQARVKKASADHLQTSHLLKNGPALVVTDERSGCCFSQLRVLVGHL